MVLRDLLFGADFALNSGYIFPTFAYYGTYYYTVHSQVWGVVIISINRYVTVCRPLSKIARLYDKIGTFPLWIINIIAPLLMMIRMLFQGSVYYYRTGPDQIALHVPLEIVKTNSLQGMIASVLGSTVCAVCYFLVIRRLIAAQRKTTGAQRDFAREKTLTIVGFSLFVALCLSTLFYILICIHAANDDANAVNEVRVYYIYALMALTFVNPWMLIITSKSTRR
ncbi:hypothetical protein PMAYCL1PPCAC_17346, partial [Pristionchus mayeri]